MWWLRACPKCGGDLVEEWDRNRRLIKCFQCGRELSTVEASRLRWQRPGAPSLPPRALHEEEAA